MKRYAAATIVALLQPVWRSWVTPHPHGSPPVQHGVPSSQADETEEPPANESLSNASAEIGSDTRAPSGFGVSGAAGVASSQEPTAPRCLSWHLLLWIAEIVTAAWAGPAWKTAKSVAARASWCKAAAPAAAANARESAAQTDLTHQALEARDKEAASLQLRCGNLEKQSRDAERECGKWRQKEGEARMDVQDIKEENHAYYLDLNKTRAELQRCIGDKQQLQRQVHVQAQRIKDGLAELDDRNARIERLESERQKDRQERQEVQQQLETIRRQLEALQAQTTALQEHNEKLTTENAKLKAEHAGALPGQREDLAEAGPSESEAEASRPLGHANATEPPPTATSVLRRASQWESGQGRVRVTTPGSPVRLVRQPVPAPGSPKAARNPGADARGLASPVQCAIEQSPPKATAGPFFPFVPALSLGGALHDRGQASHSLRDPHEQMREKMRAKREIVEGGAGAPPLNSAHSTGTSRTTISVDTPADAARGKGTLSIASSPGRVAGMPEDAAPSKPEDVALGSAAAADKPEPDKAGGAADCGVPETPRPSAGRPSSFGTPQPRPARASAHFRMNSFSESEDDAEDSCASEAGGPGPGPDEFTSKCFLAPKVSEENWDEPLHAPRGVERHTLSPSASPGKP